MSREDSTAVDGDGPVEGALRTPTPEFVRKRFALKFVIVLLIMGLGIVALGAYGTRQVAAETEEEHEFVFQTGAGSTGPAGDEVTGTGGDGESEQ